MQMNLALSNESKLNICGKRCDHVLFFPFDS